MRTHRACRQGLLVQRVVNALSLGGLLGRQIRRLRRLLVAVIFVAELRGTVGSS